MTTGGTQKEYVVDVWSGNHPFYFGNRSQLLVDTDQVEKFRKKYGELTQITQIPDLKGEIILPPKRKSGSAKGGKKKYNPRARRYELASVFLQELANNLTVSTKQIIHDVLQASTRPQMEQS
ncbi:unnamed protein product [Camellia sinensis]